MATLNTDQLQKLVQQAKAGDTDAFGTLYTEFYTPVFRYIYARTRGHKQESEDLAQTVFVRLWEHLDTYSWQGTTPLAYCFRIARNLVIDASRKKTTVGLDETMDIPDQQSPDPGQNVDRDMEAKVLRKALSQLEEMEQELLQLRFSEHLSHKEISVILEKSPEALRQMQRRAVQKLRKLLGK